MARKAFYSFHYAADAWRASQVRNMGVVDGNQPVQDNKWEEVKQGGDKAIKDWINDQLKGRSVTIVLIGANTAGRKWIKYEIEQSWKGKKGVLGIYIHNLLDSSGNKSDKGGNPFSAFKVGDKSLASIVKAYDPSYSTSTYVYDHIKGNLDTWVEDAIRIRNNYG
ncbi:TIR domain-containing protein [Candidatus Poriferisodalis sp.]|uniref:TIR domain-containing protein n=1 Tax=Candidatus Poriferisodalis sp. TaxID=3101277 RepID=UPI003B53054D